MQIYYIFKFIIIICLPIIYINMYYILFYIHIFQKHFEWSNHELGLKNKIVSHKSTWVIMREEKNRWKDQLGVIVFFVSQFVVSHLVKLNIRLQKYCLELFIILFMRLDVCECVSYNIINPTYWAIK